MGFFVQAEEQKIREEREKAEAERREVATAAEILYEEAGGEHNKGFLFFGLFSKLFSLAFAINFRHLIPNNALYIFKSFDATRNSAYCRHKKSVHFQDDFQLVYMCILNTASAKAINL